MTRLHRIRITEVTCARACLTHRGCLTSAILIPQRASWDGRPSLLDLSARHGTAAVVGEGGSLAPAAGDETPSLQLVDDQRTQLAKRYTRLSTAAAFAAIGLLTLPPSFLALKLGAPSSAAETGVGRLIGASLWGQAAALKALAGAAGHDRLASATYKRLNLGLAAWGALVVLVSVLHAAALTNIFWLQTVLAAACTVNGAFVQRLLGTPSWGELRPDLTGSKTEFGWIFTVLAVASAGLGAGLLGAPFLVFEPSKWRPDPTLVGSYLVRNYGCSLLFWSAVLFSLKDAEDRGRSTASTFRLLGQALLVTALCGAAAFLGGGLRQAALRDVLLGGIAALFLVQRQPPRQARA